MGSRAAVAAVGALTEKMTSQDADFRYMALSDLMAEARKDSFVQIDEATETKLVKQVLDTLKDKNGEVKNMGVKCLGVLVKRVRARHLPLVFDTLVEFVSSKDEELRDIASLGLKTVLAEIPPDSELAMTAGGKLAPKLIAQISDPAAAASQELLMETIDVISDVFTRFPSVVSSSADLQRNALAALLATLKHDRAAVRKRSMTALGAMAASSASENFTQLAQSIVASFQSGKLEDKRTNVQLVGILARTCPRRLGRRLPEFMPRILAAAEEDDDELREAALQTAETIILRCPNEVTPFVLQTTELAVTLLRHDPNYAGGDDDSDDEMADDDEDEEDDELIDEDYSDDDDMSWKVRRASAKTISAAISTRSELLSTFMGAVAPALVARVSEREESVRLEILATLLALLKQIHDHGDAPQATEVAVSSPGALKRKREALEAEIAADTSPRAQLQKLLPALAKALSREMTSKAVNSRLVTFTVLRELTSVLHGALEPHMGLLATQTEKAFRAADSGSGASANLKGEILTFLRVLFLLHPARSFDEHLDRLVPLLVAAIDDKVHRETLEALAAASQLVVTLCPLPTPGASSSAVKGAHHKHIIAIYEATMRRLARSDSDQEIKERGVAVLGTLHAHAGEELVDRYGESLPVLLDRLRNEVTRFATVKVVTQMAASPVCQGGEFDNFVQESLVEVAQLLRKSNRALKVAVFDCLVALLSRAHDKLTIDTADVIIAEVQPLLTQELDVNMVPIALQLMNLVLASGPDARAKVVKDILPGVLAMLQTSSLSGPALDAVHGFLRQLIASDPSSAADLVKALHAALKSGGAASNDTFVQSNVSKCLGTIAIASPQTGAQIASETLAILAKPKSPLEDVYFHLLILGEIGRVQDFGGNGDLVQRVLGFFASDSEDVKSAAAFALGNMAVGNLSTFLPIIEQHIVGDDAKRYLSLRALKELIAHGSPEQLQAVAQRIWQPLFDNCETKDESTRSIGAECLARLTFIDPAKYLAQLQDRLKSPSVATRAAVMSAIRFTLTTEASSNFDEHLALVIVDFLLLLQDPDLEVRRLAVFALNSAAHNKPRLVREHLTTLLPLLYNETKVKAELLRKVAMGPFTVVTDDGLELRKNAFETMYTLIDTCFARISLPEFLAAVKDGMTDEESIKVICYLMLVRLATLAPLQLSQYLDDLTDPMSATLKVKLKDNSTKQEVEKAAELQRAVLRALVALDRMEQSKHALKFQGLVREAKASSGSAWREVEQAQNI